MTPRQTSAGGWQAIITPSVKQGIFTILSKDDIKTLKSLIFIVFWLMLRYHELFDFLQWMVLLNKYMCGFIIIFILYYDCTATLRLLFECCMDRMNTLTVQSAVKQPPPPPAHRQQHHLTALTRRLLHQPAGSAQVVRLHPAHLQLHHRQTELWQAQNNRERVTGTTHQSTIFTLLVYNSSLQIKQNTHHSCQ